MIPFNKPYLTGKETYYIEDAVKSGKISGNGKYTKLCQAFFEEKYGFKKCLLTTSCTDALEMAAILINIEPGDEVINTILYVCIDIKCVCFAGGKNCVCRFKRIQSKYRCRYSGGFDRTKNQGDCTCALCRNSLRYGRNNGFGKKIQSVCY